MSAIAAIFNLDGRPVAADQLAEMTDSVADRAPDAAGHWAYQNVGLGHRRLETTDESRRECQPAVFADAGLFLTFAGRIDNRHRLKTSLIDRGHQIQGDTDPELVLHAYACWQLDCLDQILGDFAFALWDEAQRRMFCARDLIGARPFYYFASSRTFACGSELRQLLVLPEIPRDPNEGMIGEYLLSAMHNKEETQFRSIHRLPPASAMTVDSQGIRQWAFWEPGSVVPVQYSAEDYAEHLHGILESAVECRLRSHRPVAVQLSGGVDSSSVLALARDLSRQGPSASKGLEAFSLIFPGWECDETHYIDEVEQTLGLTTYRAFPRPRPHECNFEQVRKYRDFPDYPNGTMSDPLESEAQRRGLRVMLTGLGGDEWFQRSDYYLADLLRRGRLAEFRRYANSFPDNRWWPIRSSPAFAFGMRPLIPTVVVNGYRGVRKSRSLPDWIGAELAQQASLEERLNETVEWKEFASYAQAGVHWAASKGFQTHAIEMEERSASAHHLELRYPFHDRRIIEFGLSLPADQRWRDGFHKWVLRCAMRRQLPPSIVERRDKVEFSRVFVEALRELGQQRFQDLELARRGWVVGERVEQMFCEMDNYFEQNDRRFRSNLWNLWHVYGAELWLEASQNC